MTESSPSRPKQLHHHLSRRESQIMDALYELGESTVADLFAFFGKSPSYDSIRVTLGVLEKKGHVLRRATSERHMYRPAVPREEARGSVLRHLLGTFFEGSAPRAMEALVDLSATDLDTAELRRLRERIDAALEEREGAGDRQEDREDGDA